MQPTIVLVHGAFAESASWDGVIDPLLAAGHDVVAAANPLRGLASDAAAVSDVVAHDRRAGRARRALLRRAVISNVDADAGDIVGLVYVNGFAPEPGESCFELAAMFPGSTLGEATVQPVPCRDGATDFYIVRDRYHDMFCADVPAPQAAVMAATQRPATQEALVEPSGQRPLWKHVPSWFLIGEEDRIIPPLSSATWPSGPTTEDGRGRGRVARHRRLASRRDGAPDPRGRSAARARLTRSAIPHATRAAVAAQRVTAPDAVPRRAFQWRGAVAASGHAKAAARARRRSVERDNPGRCEPRPNVRCSRRAAHPGCLCRSDDQHDCRRLVARGRAGRGP